MEMAKITAKGQITIPRKIREMMAVDPGDVLAFELDDRPGVRIVPVRSNVRPLRGFLAKHAVGGKIDADRIQAALRLRAAKKHQRN